MKTTKMVLRVLGVALVLGLVEAGNLEFDYPESYSTYTSPEITDVGSSAISYQAPLASSASPAISTYSTPILKKYAANTPIISKGIVEESSPAAYDFEYAVDDPHTGDAKIHQESRRGDQVQGRYSLVEPDGTKRTVEYVADHNGFNAVVHKEPLNHGVGVAAPLVTKVAAPLATYAPAAAYGYGIAPGITKISSSIAGYAANPSFDYADIPAIARIGVPAYGYSGLQSLGHTAKIYADESSIYSPSYAYH
ncbi:hypothetical protein Trydic_g15484 [Trypoxylus dichotomus]